MKTRVSLKYFVTDCRPYRILFIILIHLCIHYADRSCINLNSWNIFQQHNWHNYAWFFCFHDDNENEAVEAHIPRHRDSKTKKPRHRDSKIKKRRHQDSKTKKPRHRDSGTKTPQHREMKANKPQHHDSKTFFQRAKSHDVEIPRLTNHDIEILRPKSRDIEFLWNSDPYAPWYQNTVQGTCFREKQTAVHIVF